ncbi:DUF3825 domain-containing protein [Myroides odoratimimus]|uniref:DUF3825 domain-containing protein n=1 Tax=Myroides odoratimimus TaxID=76832 RepID=UPI0025772122|nr:DUF3825 domain-containing protein [Myroides odoratimimus]MDM1494983.1 DUF3825 domain-containing protein [Myroides odoratimimus]
MTLFDFTFMPNFDSLIEELRKMAINEKWDYSYKVKNNHPILCNYINHTFKKVYQDNLIVKCSDEEYAIFNTGLVTPNQEEIFAFMQKNNREGARQPYFFHGWKIESDRNLSRFTKLASLPNYIDNPSNLIYDTGLDLRVNIEHIISDNIARFPKNISSLDKSIIRNILSGAIDDAKKRVRRNYKTAIPQYYNGQLQLLLPICFGDKSVADLALVVERDNGGYRANTCLTLDMAINNARLIAKPDDEWLKI